MRIPNRISGFVGATLIMATLLLVSPSAVNGADNWAIVGTWMVWGEIMPGSRIPSLHTFHPDGTATASDVFSFGGLPGVPIRSTPMYGVWERARPNVYAGTYMSMIYDAGSSIFIGFMRARAELSFEEKDVNEVSTTVYVDFLPCASPVSCSDPQSPDAAWTSFPGFPPSIKATATRLNLVPVP